MRRSKYLFDFRILLIAAFFLSGCDRQPTLLEKIELERQAVTCLTSTTTRVETHDSELLKLLEKLTSELQDLTLNPNAIPVSRWQVIGDPVEKIIMYLDVTDYEYACEFAKASIGNYWELKQVRRDGKLVFDLVEDLKAREIIRQDKLALTKGQWREEVFPESNVKYYEKHAVSSDGQVSEYLKIRVICDQGGPIFEYATRNTYLKMGKELYFLFIGENDEVPVYFLITEAGRVGSQDYKPNLYLPDYYDSEKNEELLSLLKKSKAVRIYGNYFDLGGILGISCL